MEITNLINQEQFYAGVPTNINDLCKIYPATLKEIAEIGVKNFYSYLNYFTLDKEDIKEYLTQAGYGDKEMTVFQFHLLNSALDSQYSSNFKNAIKFFTHENCTLLPDNEAIIFGDIKENRIIKEEEFIVISKIICAQHSTSEGVEEEKENPSDARAAQILKKIKESKKKVNQARKNDLSFVDLVASLAAKGNGLNAINVWDLTYFAFNDQFKRMQWIEEYDTAMKSLLAGAKKESVKLVHWIRPMNER